MFISTLVYFILALANYTESPLVTNGEIVITLIVYIIFTIVNLWLTKRFMWRSILYMLASDVLEWCNDHSVTCEDYKLLDKSG